ncbi:MAG: hypothetical protein JOZ38_08440 [Candidatus Eremiobacteraeota bacterium]|nr:hypothetical protein [Candidatus Eremiobacteraeota bacterium]
MKLRFLGRMVVVFLGTIAFALVGIQFTHIVGRNIAMARSLHDVENDVQTLRARKIEQEREVQRLTTPQGAVPEIHDRLHYVGPHETIIYLKR